MALKVKCDNPVIAELLARDPGFALDDGADITAETPAAPVPYKEYRLRLLSKFHRIISIGQDAVLDTKTRTLTGKDGDTILTQMECDIITYLASRDMQAPRDEMLADVFGYSMQADTRTLDTHIYRLRAKLEQIGASRVLRVCEKVIRL
ncbi:MAG: winged helix-turn-helix domain-containing protein [Alphaproteobacteria bacterium]|nr:winged helix-turn-helix domain-containing protein [Alphaproteobacteria bacterium]